MVHSGNWGETCRSRTNGRMSKSRLSIKVSMVPSIRPGHASNSLRPPSARRHCGDTVVTTHILDRQRAAEGKLALKLRSQLACTMGGTTTAHYAHLHEHDGDGAPGGGCVAHVRNVAGHCIHHAVTVVLAGPLAAVTQTGFDAVTCPVPGHAYVCVCVDEIKSTTETFVRRKTSSEHPFPTTTAITATTKSKQQPRDWSPQQ